MRMQHEAFISPPPYLVGTRLQRHLAGLPALGVLLHVEGQNAVLVVAVVVVVPGLNKQDVVRGESCRAWLGLGVL